MGLLEKMWKHQHVNFLLCGAWWGFAASAHCWVLRGQRPAPLWGWGFLLVGGPAHAAPCGCGGGGVRVVVENCTVDASIFVLCCVLSNCFVPVGRDCVRDDVGWCVGQVVKGARWMPGHQEPMKDVGGCDIPRGVANRAVIRGCPNGVTRHSSWGVTPA